MHHIKNAAVKNAAVKISSTLHELSAGKLKNHLYFCRGYRWQTYPKEHFC